MKKEKGFPCDIEKGQSSLGFILVLPKPSNKNPCFVH